MHSHIRHDRRRRGTKLRISHPRCSKNKVNRAKRGPSVAKISGGVEVRGSCARKTTREREREGWEKRREDKNERRETRNKPYDGKNVRESRDKRRAISNGDGVSPNLRSFSCASFPLCSTVALKRKRKFT
ncbi:hypothetical protein QLX08_004431 [Tetragonisca angustula]|uniref:Uncharacterized protein n=1 Tax=Tetragonisca angustula TaxID=166442 RepID=A0AAW1A4A7_9HYME